MTDRIAKPLLPLAERPMLDFILDRVREVDAVEGVHVVTNARFAADFEAWAPADVTVHDDGTTSNEDRLGAIGDMRFVLDRIGDTDLLVIAGDNLFDYSLAEYVEWWRGKGEASAVTVYEHPDLELVKQYSVVALDEDDRIVSFVEKPEEPQSSLVATACYLYHREHVEFVRAYLDDGNVPDQPGRLVEWLYTRAPVYGYRFTGNWLDIGDRDQLLEADNLMRARAGLPVRNMYAP